jgi:hypothetical protein
MTPAQEQMALDAVRGTLNLHPEPNALGAARIRIYSSDGPGGTNRRNALARIAQAVKRIRERPETANSLGVPGLSEASPRARAARVFALAFFAAFGVATAIPLIILAHLIDWTGVAESIGLY